MPHCVNFHLNLAPHYFFFFWQFTHTGNVFTLLTFSLFILDCGARISPILSQTSYSSVKSERFPCFLTAISQTRTVSGCVFGQWAMNAERWFTGICWPTSRFICVIDFLGFILLTNTKCLFCSSETLDCIHTCICLYYVYFVSGIVVNIFSFSNNVKFRRSVSKTMEQYTIFLWTQKVRGRSGKIQNIPQCW